MPSSEFTRWQRYFVQEPFGVVRDNMHAALVAREIRRVMTGQDPKLDNYMLKPAPTPEELHEMQRRAWDSAASVKES